MKQVVNGDIGMKAVASVIMNRVNTPVGEYSRVSQGGNIRNILFQPPNTFRFYNFSSSR